MLTPAQYQTLKADIAANPALNALPNNSDGNLEIVDHYKQPATPAFTVWKSSVEVADLMNDPFDWTRVDNLTIGKARIWEWMTTAVVVHPSRPNVRAGFLAVFATASDLPCRQAIFNGASQLANRAEKLFAVGTGSPPTDMGVGPATMAFEGQLSVDDVKTARSM